MLQEEGACLDRERVGHDLHGVVVVGEAVHDGHVGVLRELEEVAVRMQARHDDVVELGHDARDVARLLALADLDRVGVEVQRVAAHAEETLRRRQGEVSGGAVCTVLHCAVGRRWLVVQGQDWGGTMYCRIRAIHEGRSAACTRQCDSMT